MRLKSFYLSLAVFAVVFAARFGFVSAYGVDVPFWDQLEGEGERLYLKYISGNLQFRDFFLSHNEHRILWMRLFNLAVFSLNGNSWSPLLVMKFQALIPAFTASLLAYIFHTRFKSLILVVLTGISFALPFAVENLLWGFQNQFYFLIAAMHQ